MRKLFLLYLSSFILLLSACQPATATKPEKPSALPEIHLYANESPLNQKIAGDAVLDPNSARYVEAIAETAGTALLQIKQYSSPVYFADEDTPHHNVALKCGRDWELGITALRNVPIPDFAAPANDAGGTGNPVRGCGEESDQDNNMVIIDLTRGCEYDFWQARMENGRWVASWANAIPIKSNGIYEHGLSSRGSGFAFLAGVIWPHELRVGYIPHALLAALPDKLIRGGGPVPPATESDGESLHPFALPEGARLRLDPSLDLESLNLSAVELTIARAMQEYGVFITDRGGGSGLSLYAIDPLSVLENPYRGLLPDEDYPALANIPLDQFQVLLLPPQDSNFQENIKLPVNSCAEFE